jgi:hypothetical protein
MQARSAGSVVATAAVAPLPAATPLAAQVAAPQRPTAPATGPSSPAALTARLKVCLGQFVEDVERHCYPTPALSAQDQQLRAERLSALREQATALLVPFYEEQRQEAQRQAQQRQYQREQQEDQY